MPWFHSDFLRSTQGWTVNERGVYFLLLGASWEMGPLPDDRRRLAGIVGAQLDEFDEAWKLVRTKFELTEKGLINRRLEIHREKQAIRSEAARRSVMTRWKDDGEYETDTDVSTSEHTSADTPVILEGIRNSYGKAYETHTPQNSDLKSQILEKDKNSTARRARSTNAKPTEQHQQIIDAYHELCPALPQVKVWTAKRRQSLDARIAERKAAGKPADVVDYWRDVFQQVAGSDFLCGRSVDFRADLEWLIRPENFAKVIEGRYSGNRKTNGAGTHG
jgi:uncharacterized protein YdaU (DUF1376 family)